MTDKNLPSIAEMLDQLSRITEREHGISRQFLTPEHKKVNDLVGNWMRLAGMVVWQDPIGNIFGRYQGNQNDLPVLMLGSHLDTVVDAGKYDGILGVATAIHCVAALHNRKKRLPFALEVIGFADEEGTRFQSTYLGSKAVAGTFDYAALDRLDTAGISMKEALISFGLEPEKIQHAARSADEIAAYIELHIEQGPVLENEKRVAGIVTGIAGSTRMTIRITGKAGHAGTVPFNLRQDALVAASECILAVEQKAKEHENTVATVGEISIQPGASNVIPGEAMFTVDLRSAKNHVRQNVEAELLQALETICRRRSVDIVINKTHDAPSINCSKNIIKQLENTFNQCGYPPRLLPSGAGHDAAAMSDLTDVGMIFLRCKNGVSHSPAEFVKQEDLNAGMKILLKFVENFQLGSSEN